MTGIGIAQEAECRLEVEGGERVERVLKTCSSATRRRYAVLQNVTLQPVDLKEE